MSPEKCLTVHRYWLEIIFCWFLIIFTFWNFGKKVVNLFQPRGPPPPTPTPALVVSQKLWRVWEVTLDGGRRVFHSEADVRNVPNPPAGPASPRVWYLIFKYYSSDVFQIYIFMQYNFLQIYFSNGGRSQECPNSNSSAWSCPVLCRPRLTWNMHQDCWWWRQFRDPSGH